ncbi:hypothetical protein C8Q78DRAFT_385580 [Trametes maxima]|nr:hypothetical protein C8Q78DRAFT_385580 [Trametes maxima]
MGPWRCIKANWRQPCPSLYTPSSRHARWTRSRPARILVFCHPPRHSDVFTTFPGISWTPEGRIISCHRQPQGPSSDPSFPALVVRSEPDVIAFCLSPFAPIGPFLLCIADPTGEARLSNATLSWHASCMPTPLSVGLFCAPVPRIALENAFLGGVYCLWCCLSSLPCREEPSVPRGIPGPECAVLQGLDRQWETISLDFERISMLMLRKPPWSTLESTLLPDVSSNVDTNAARQRHSRHLRVLSSSASESVQSSLSGCTD